MERVIVVLITVTVAVFTPSTLALKLEMNPPVVSPGQEVTINCFDSEMLESVAVVFPNGEKFDWTTLGIDFSALEGVSRTLCLPLTESKRADRFGLLQKCGNSSGIQLSMRPRRRLGGEVLCEAVRNSSNQKQKDSSNLKFNWTSSVNISGSSSVELGSTINFTCRFRRGMDGQEESFKGIDSSWKMEKKNFTDAFGIDTVVYSFSKSATIADNGTRVNCSIEKNSKTLEFSVIDRSIPMFLKAQSGSMQANISLNFTCGPTKALDRPFVVIMALLEQKEPLFSIARVYDNSTFFRQFVSADFYRDGLGESKWWPINRLPADATLQPLANGKLDRLQLRLTPWPRHNGAKLICRIESSYGRKNRTQQPLNVKWNASLQAIRLQNSAKQPILFVLEKTPAFVNCTFRLGDASAIDANVTIEGPDGAEIKETPSSNYSRKDQFGFQYRSKLWKVKFHKKHNKLVITCKLANQKTNFTLNVTYPPRIKIFSPASSATPTPVKTPLRCLAKGNPPANVTLQLRSRSPLRSVLKLQAIDEVKTAIPLNTSKGTYELICKTENYIGSDKKNRTLTITKLDLPVSLKVTTPVFSVASGGHLSCDSEDSDVSFLKLQIRRLDLTIALNISSKSLNVSFKGNKFTEITKLPFFVSNDIQLMKTASKIIKVFLRVKPNFNGTKVTCQGQSVGKAGKDETVITTKWEPSVRRVVVTGDTGLPPNEVEEKKPATMTCEAQKGSEKKAIVRAKIGEKELGKPLKNVALGKDVDGFEWEEFSWKTSLSRDQHGAELVCWVPGSLKKTIVSVLWKPYNTTITFDNASLSVNCSSLGNPIPNVNLTMFDEDLQPVNVAYGLGGASLSLYDVVGNFSFICVANNSIDSDEDEWSWFGEAVPNAFNEDGVMLLIIIAAGMSGGLVFSFLFVSVIKGCSSRPSPPPNVESRERGTEEVLLDTRIDNVPDESAETSNIETTK